MGRQHASSGAGRDALLRWDRWISRTGRRIRRRLGFPRFSRRAWLLALLGLLALIYVGTTVMSDLITKLVQYEPQYYDPKDFPREEFLKKMGESAEKREKETP